MPVKKVVIDTDPGTDDALAIIMALNSPDLDVLGLTTVGGNVSLVRTTGNALRLLDYLGRGDVPVARGAARPIRGRFPSAAHVHGRSGLTVDLPPARRGPINVRAASYLVSVTSALRGELTLIALGPLTNLARALSAEPRMAGWVRHLVVMGGAVKCGGNVTPNAEFNIHADPEAAHAVLGSGIPATLVGLDVTTRLPVRRGDLSMLTRNAPSGDLALRILEGWFEAEPDRGAYDPHDALAVAAAIRPELLTYRQAKVSVDTTDSLFRGKTTAEYGAGNVQVALGVDARAASELVWTLAAGQR